MRTIDAAVTMRDAMTLETLTPSTEDLTAYQSRIATTYVAAPVEDDAVRTSYAALMAECLTQWAALSAAIDVTFCDDDPTPLDPTTGRISHRLFVEEVATTNTLRVFRSRDDEHGILCAETTVHNGRTENLNSIFRAVHDWFGHLASGGHFGWSGETKAYYSHASMFTVAARQALFSETVAQQCYYATYRDFAPQKTVAFGVEEHCPPMK